MSYYIKALDKRITDKELESYKPAIGQVYRRSNGGMSELYKILKCDGYVAYSKTTIDMSNRKSLYGSDDTYTLFEYNKECSIPLLDWIEFLVSENLELLDSDAFGDVTSIAIAASSKIKAVIDMMARADGTYDNSCPIGCDDCDGWCKECFGGNKRERCVKSVDDKKRKGERVEKLMREVCEEWAKERVEERVEELIERRVCECD